MYVVSYLSAQFRRRALHLRVCGNPRSSTQPRGSGAATELKLKLLKCKQTIQIATFNVRTLNRIGQLPELTASAVEHKIDIICIQKHRYTHTEDIK